VVKFEAVLSSDPGGGGGTFISIPGDIAAQLGLTGMPERRLNAAVAKLGGG